MGLTQQGISCFPEIFSHMDDVKNQGEVGQVFFYLQLQGPAAIGQGDPLGELPGQAVGNLVSRLFKSGLFPGQRAKDLLTSGRRALLRRGSWGCSK
jgi:hypothetical protein